MWDSPRTCIYGCPEKCAVSAKSCLAWLYRQCGRSRENVPAVPSGWVWRCSKWRPSCRWRLWNPAPALHHCKQKIDSCTQQHKYHLARDLLSICGVIEHKQCSESHSEDTNRQYCLGNYTCCKIKQDRIWFTAWRNTKMLTRRSLLSKSHTVPGCKRKCNQIYIWINKFTELTT